MNKKHQILILLSLIYILLRLLILFHSNNLFVIEEVYMGTIANELVVGPHFKLLDYQRGASANYAGGLLFQSFLIIPFYLLFGITGISLKLAPLLISTLIFVLVFLFVEKFFHIRVAIIVSLLFIFSIPYYTISTLSQAGPALLSTLFALLVMTIYFHIFFNNKRHVKYFILFGLISGLSIWNMYDAAVMLAVCFLFWFAFDKSFFLRKHFRVFFIFFLFGFSPWLYYNVTHEWGGVDILKERFLEGSSSRVIPATTKLKNFFFYDLIDSFYFDLNYSQGKIISYAYYLIFLFSLCYLVWVNRKSLFRWILALTPPKKFYITRYKIKKELFLIIYFLFFILVYSLSNFSVGTEFSNSSDEYRYILPLFPFIFIMISIFISYLWDIRKTKKISFMILFVLLSAGVLGNLGLILDKPVPRDIIYTPYSYNFIGVIAGDLYGDNLSYAFDICNTLNVGHQIDCYDALSVAIGRKFADNILDGSNKCSSFSDEYKSLCYQSLGFYSNVSPEEFLNISSRECEVLYIPYRNYCYEGVAWSIGYSQRYTKDYDFSICDGLPSQYRSICYESKGHNMLFKFTNKLLDVERECNELDEEFRPPCYEGFGRALGFMYKADITYATPICNKLDIAYIPSCLRGLNGTIIRCENSYIKDITECDALIPRHKTYFSFIADISH